MTKNKTSELVRVKIDSETLLLPRSEASKYFGKLGGRPKGSGRKQLEKEMTRQAIEKKILEQTIPLIEAKLDLALGHSEQIQIGNKNFKYYDRMPDSGAIEDLLNRVFGKPKDQGQDRNWEALTELGKTIREILTPKPKK